MIGGFNFKMELTNLAYVRRKVFGKIRWISFMHRDKNDIKERLEVLFKDLMEIALEDSKLSHDEQEILGSIKNDLDNLSKQLMQILEDDLDEGEFRDICTQILEDIIVNAQNIAKKDEIITYEEKKLLDRLSEFVVSEELFQ